MEAFLEAAVALAGEHGLDLLLVGTGTALAGDITDFIGAGERQASAGMTEALGDEDVQVPRQAEFAADPAHLLGPGLADLSRDSRTEQGQGGAQAANGDS